jgi:hypothetical protein
MLKVLETAACTERAMSRSALAELDPWRLFSTMTKISYAGCRPTLCTTVQ